MKLKIEIEINTYNNDNAELFAKYIKSRTGKAVVKQMMEHVEDEFLGLRDISNTDDEGYLLEPKQFCPIRSIKIK